MSPPSSADPVSETAPMKPPTKTITLTLVVATTPITTRSTTTKPLLGIGLNGTLPWPRIKSDMNFFARVTSRPPPPQEKTSPEEAEMEENKGKEKLNAIIMGRKTYYSLPKSLRPLKDRLNVIISRDESGSVAAEVERDLARQREKAEKDGKEDKRDAVVARGLEDALKQLFDEQRQDLGHVFVIGGGEIYRSSLELSSSISALTESRIVQRILMTRVKRRDGEEYECDTFFPLTDEDLSETSTKGWRQAGAEEVTGWVGERVGEEWIEEGEVAIKVEGYERA